MRIFGVFGCVISLALQTPLTTFAAVPVYVVNQPPGITETSLEAFMADLFNTLANRQEDFTAAFELTKIEKAREDVNKLYQETLKELQDFGLAYNVTDRKTNEVPMVSPLKGPRIINDPFEYIFGEPIQKARAYAACYINFVIWDQQGELDVNGDGDNTDAILAALDDGDSARADERPKSTYSTVPNSSSAAQKRTSSIQNLRELRKEFGILNTYGNWYQTSNLKEEDPFIANLFLDTSKDRVEGICNRVFEITRTHNIRTAYKAVDLHGVNPSSPKGEGYIRQLVGLPTLSKSLLNRNDVRSEELVHNALNSTNSLQGVRAAVRAGMEQIINETKAIRSLQFVAGQGIRPEYLYTVESSDTECTFLFLGCEPDNTFLMNTEYVISPAVILLQKMQAATQAQYDIAGQGFLYIDPENTSSDANTARSRYRVSTNRSATSTTGERGVCNNETDGSDTCFLVSPWLKPNVGFRSAPNALYLEPADGITGLPAAWEDETSSLSLGYNYNVRDYNYSGTSTSRIVARDNLGNYRLGSDYATNDWYDRVLEMYETKYDNGDSLYPDAPILKDWACYIRTWMKEKVIDNDDIRYFTGNTDDSCRY